jgi:dihydrofolate synthase / folylpolyglutamate synthase
VSRPIRDIRLGLDRPRRLLDALGHPHEAFPAVLIAGTNGKGSTAALLTSVLHHAGHRVGWFRSPALTTDRDQIGIGPDEISAEDFRRVTGHVETVAREALEDGATPFEALTATAFLHFAETAVDIAILEAGMGGARDATNVVEPILSMVTSVALEHTEYLGDTVEAIARDKAGVFRRERPALASSRTAGSAWQALSDAAGKTGAFFHDVAREVTVHAASGPEKTAPGKTGASFPVRVETPVTAYDLALPLAGAHQHHNLSFTVRAAELLADNGWDRVSAPALRAGVAATRLPGRLEGIRLPAGRDLLLDGAHNPAAVAVLAEYLDTLRTASPQTPVHLLFGVLQDKAVEAMLPPLAARAGRVTLTRPPGPRGRAPEELRALAGAAARGPVEIEADVETALRLALQALPPEGVLLVTGSLALVGKVRGLLGEGLSWAQ